MKNKMTLLGLFLILGGTSEAFAARSAGEQHGGSWPCQLGTCCNIATGNRVGNPPKDEYETKSSGCKPIAAGPRESGSLNGRVPGGKIQPVKVQPAAVHK